MAKAASRIFYRVDCIGTAPASGAMLLLPNHPNALLDPAIIWATADRDVRFLAKSTLFQGPWRPVLAGAGAIPVYRRLDQGADVSRNAETFVAVDAALAAGDAICIFPEGISHSTGRLEPLRTGAARMALTAERAGTRVALVPVGLNFERKAAFRSRVTVVYGAPLSATDLAEGDEATYADRVRQLTDRIADHMRRLLVEADPKADAAIVDRVDRLYAAARGRPKDPEERLARRRAIAAGIHRLRSADPSRYDELLLRLRRYDERLRRFGLRDRHLDWQVPAADAFRFAVRELAVAIVLMPLAALGFALFFVPYHVTGLVARRFTREPDVIATAQVVAGALIYGVWFAFAGWVVWQLWGATAAAIAAALLPVLALLSLFAIERESAVVDAVKAWFLLRRARDETRERLRRRRSELADVLDEVYAWLGGADTAGAPQ
jgi:glycerol-3-phosphate O-acyltransferase/dihydroxyacetone phosphate acyltransferase